MKPSDSLFPRDAGRISPVGLRALDPPYKEKHLPDRFNAGRCSRLPSELKEDMSGRTHVPASRPAAMFWSRVLVVAVATAVLRLTGPGQSSASAPAGGVSRPAAGLVHGPVAGPVGQEHPGEEAYRQHCTICHGQQGKGDGPAASAFDPAPPDFTSPESVVLLTDDELLEIVVKGRRAMPAFETVLEPALLPVLVRYVRDLSNLAD